MNYPTSFWGIVGLIAVVIAIIAIFNWVILPLIDRII